jgi:hypothetical protein
MKFSIIIQIILSLVTYLFAKSHKSRSKGHPDPSYNPIRSDWVSGARIDRPIVYSHKHQNNHKDLLVKNAYRDTTKKLQRKALRKR